jgi:hypothetical protein
MRASASHSYIAGSRESYCKTPFDRYKKDTMCRIASGYVRERRISDRALAVYRLLLVEHHNCKTGECRPSQETLAKALGLCADTVRKCLSQLKAAGMIAVTHIKRIVRGLQGIRCYGQDSNGYSFTDITQKSEQNQCVSRDPNISAQTHSIDIFLRDFKSVAVDNSVDNATFFAMGGQKVASAKGERGLPREEKAVDKPVDNSSPLMQKIDGSRKFWDPQERLRAEEEDRRRALDGPKMEELHLGHLLQTMDFKKERPVEPQPPTVEPPPLKPVHVSSNLLNSRIFQSERARSRRPPEDRPRDAGESQARSWWRFWRP